MAAHEMPVKVDRTAARREEDAKIMARRQKEDGAEVLETTNLAKRRAAEDAQLAAKRAKEDAADEEKYLADTVGSGGAGKSGPHKK